MAPEPSARASSLVTAGAFHGAELRRAREQGLRKNSTRLSQIGRERNRIAGICKTFDLDGDGVLTSDEFACALRRINPELREAQVRSYAMHVERDQHGNIPYADFCEKLSTAAETCRVHTPSYLKGIRWVDNGDIIGNTDEDERKLHHHAIPIDFKTTAQQVYSRPFRDTSLPAGIESHNLHSAARDQLMFDEWDTLNLATRRGRGVSSFQSGGLRFDDKGYQAGTVGRGTAQPSPRFRTTAQRGMQSSAVRECLQPEIETPRPTTAPSDTCPRSAERVWHLKNARYRARVARLPRKARPARIACR